MVLAATVTAPAATPTDHRVGRYRRGGNDLTLDLANRSCAPSRRGVPPLTREQFAPLLDALDGWDVQEDRKLQKTYRFPDWVQAQAFVVAAGAIAEAENHHPDLLLAWGRVGAEIFTHRINGLTEADFVLAAKLDRLFAERNVSG
jgi:4a-hydroxytetrahydrobiopterin dehydratase